MAEVSTNGNGHSSTIAIIQIRRNVEKAEQNYICASNIYCAIKQFYAKIAT